MLGYSNCLLQLYLFLKQINFVGEGSVDYGGPRREFFRLLALNAKEMWFVGSSDKKFFANNVLGVQVGNQNIQNLMSCMCCKKCRQKIFTILAGSALCPYVRVVMGFHSLLNKFISISLVASVLVLKLIPLTSQITHFSLFFKRSVVTTSVMCCNDIDF